MLHRVEIHKKNTEQQVKEPNEVQNMKSDLEKIKELASATKKQSRALFSDDTKIGRAHV